MPKIAFTVSLFFSLYDRYNSSNNTTSQIGDEGDTEKLSELLNLIINKLDTIPVKEVLKMVAFIKTDDLASESSQTSQQSIVISDDGVVFSVETE